MHHKLLKAHEQMKLNWSNPTPKSVWVWSGLDGPFEEQANERMYTICSLSSIAGGPAWASEGTGEGACAECLTG
jgi:hypothetical protein